MGLPLPSENFRGYQKSSLIDRVEGIRGKDFFLAHGMADRNVHVQNSMILAKKFSIVVYFQNSPLCTEIRVGQFSKVSFTPSLIDGVFHADSKNGLFSCLGQAINFHSGFKVWPFFSGFPKEKAGRNSFGIKLLEPKDVFCLYFHVARLKK